MASAESSLNSERQECRFWAGTASIVFELATVLHRVSVAMVHSFHQQSFSEADSAAKCYAPFSGTQPNRERTATGSPRQPRSAMARRGFGL